MPSDARLEILSSRGLPGWLADANTSLAFTTYQAGKLFLLGLQPDGRLSLFERSFNRCMGLCAHAESLWLSTLFQVWRLENALPAGHVQDGHDRLYVPRVAHTTGDLDVHDLAVTSAGQVVFVNTLFSCLATLSDRASFVPLWRPPFISRLAAEDRCHLNGLALADGVVDLDAVPAAPEWADPSDPRHAISLRHLMAMRSGLEFNEDYVDAGTSHCLEMLFGEASADMAHYAASQQLVAPVDSTFNYASGSTNIVSRALKQALGLDQAGFDAYLHERLFDPIGMSRATPHYDGAGTFVGSSYVYATARDFARYGYLHLRDGMWDGRRILPEGWVDVARTARSGPDEDGQYYGAFWWVWGDEHGTFAGQGYEGQLVAVVPALDLVLVRLGKSPIAHRPALFQFYRDVISAFADGAAGEGDPR